MRRFFAISLLSVHFFTVGGYRLALGYFEHKADALLVQKINQNDYNESELITLKVPLNLPYFNSSNSFERCDGTININGVFYNYVQRKLMNDTLVLQCIPNNEKSKLSQVNIEYAKTAGNTLPSSSEKAITSLFKLFFFDNNYKAGRHLPEPLSGLSWNCVLANDNRLCAPFISSPSKPPETM